MTVAPVSESVRRRVYLGVHWPTDVLGGFIAASLLLAGLELAYYRPHRCVSHRAWCN